MKLDAALRTLLHDKDEGERAHIAVRVGERLTNEELPDAERLAAEALARDLVRDAIERVRRELATAVRHAKCLPRDIALKIAHDVDAVACPFLEATEVFSEADWQQLVLTISRGARVAVARRTSMTEGLALLLAETGDTVVAETLIANAAAPMSAAVGHTLIGRFDNAAWVLDKLAERDGLVAEIAVKLLPKVSEAAREKLARVHGVGAVTDPLAAEAEIAALLRWIREAAESQLPAIVEALRRESKLSQTLVLRALRDGPLVFFEVAIATLANARLEHVRSVVRHGSAMAFTKLLAQSHIPPAQHGDVWDVLQAARARALVAASHSA